MNATLALGWALVHFVWQGAAAAVLLGLLLALTRPAAARLRYALSVATLAVMVAFPIATGTRLAGRRLVEPNDGPAPATVAASQLPEVPSRTSTTVSTLETLRQPAAPIVLVARAQLETALPWLVALWVTGVLVLSARLASGWSAVGRLRTERTRPVTDSVRDMLDRLIERLRISRPVQLLESALVEVPAVIGWLRPVVLVPASALTGLTPQQLEVLLAHELAHVRRHDYLVNVAQTVIETLLFYHPAVWWVSRRVREEREHCCDDVAVRVCGDAHFYAAALAGMERLRLAPPELALAATGARGSSLLDRVRRLVAPAAPQPRVDLLPRWAAGVVAVTVALTSVGGARLAGAPAAAQADAVPATDTLRSRPDTVLRHPDPAQPLAQRWDWAHAQAHQLRRQMYWIGYMVRRPEWLDNAVYVDRDAEIKAYGITLQGRSFGDFRGFAFRGVRLSAVLGGGAADTDDILMLFGFSTSGGRPTLVHIHVSSAFLPVDFAGRTLVWLGAASDAQSLPVVEGLFAQASPQLKEDVVAALGIHGSSGAVVPVLVRWMTGSEPTDVRTQAAEWLGFHPDAAAVQALARAARSDRAPDVRREAAEALGDNTLPAATDSLLAVARTGGDPDMRREAVESIGNKEPARALPALQGISRSDPDPDVQREAVEALGQLGVAGVAALTDIARTHASSDVRREAIETLGESSQTAETARLLADIARKDMNDDVQREAIESLGELGALGLPSVFDMARTHPSADVRRKALETIGEQAPAGQARDLLLDVARRDADPDVQRAAVEALGEMKEPGSFALLVDIARTHPVSDVRRAAIETMAENGPVDSVLAVLDGIAQRAADPDEASKAVETLGELRDRRALERVATIARTHKDMDVRTKAIETYAENATADAAIALIRELLANDAPEDIQQKALESLEELDGGAGIPVLIDIAQTHPRREVRAEAIRRLAESDDPRAQQLFEQTLRRP